ncbi:putative Tyrosinase [Glarea lozoyensis 74030]|uniref:Putative Tyrosinase n=1 Tax=Glarea lozoyensis (strain ATCC 74030 / MF5533) TaxID=1104152 RepID=H0ESF8_GLAL7|nr:putative Tyrosinase [Glarea lozoyensis 74030]
MHGRSSFNPIARMRFSYVTLLTALSLLELPNVLGAVTFADPAELKIRNDKRELEKLTQKALDKILTKLDKDEEELKKAGKKATCTRKTLRYKLEFGSMQKKDRKGYTDAVTCLQKLKAKTPAAIAPGARGRNDDFVVTHVLQTPYVHMSGTFLGWHRYYLWVYEEALRNECGYKGPIPYWDWPKWADAPQDSPLFNGDAYSLGGNGDFIPGHPGLTLNFGNTTTVLPAGLGGGCVTKGPFKDMVVNLGPVLIGTPGPLPSGLGYNPRCLKRDVGPAVAMRWSNYTSVLETFKREDIGNFQTFIQGPGTETATESGIGVHGGGVRK